jgi:tRNA nucleotidyltransferase/poly(A) polymerase
LNGKIKVAFTIFDPLGKAIKDLQDGALVTVSPASFSFDEDPKRILRAIEFSCRLDLSLGDLEKKILASKSLLRNYFNEENTQQSQVPPTEEKTSSGDSQAKPLFKIGNLTSRLRKICCTGSSEKIYSELERLNILPVLFKGIFPEPTDQQNAKAPFDPNGWMKSVFRYADGLYYLNQGINSDVIYSALLLHDFMSKNHFHYQPDQLRAYLAEKLKNDLLFKSLIKTPYLEDLFIMTSKHLTRWRAAHPNASVVRNDIISSAAPNRSMFFTPQQQQQQYYPTAAAAAAPALPYQMSNGRSNF